MSFSIAGYVDPCEGNIKDECWMVSVNGLPETEIDKPCWEVYVEAPKENGTLDCWRVYGTTNCEQGDPNFTNPLETDKHGIFKVYAVHITNNDIYMAVKMRAFDDEPAKTYLDEWASSTTQIGVDAYAYYPSYKATEIVRVFDVFGDLQYLEGVDENGYKYIIIDKEDLVFSVIYKMDSGYRIIKGGFTSAWDRQSHYMDYIERSLSIPAEMVVDGGSDKGAEGCLLMGKDIFTTSPTIVFKSNTKMNYLLKFLPFNEMELQPLATMNLNYMLREDIAMNHASANMYYVEQDYGVSRVFANNNPNQNSKYGYDTVVGIMQVDYDSNTRTVGFPSISTSSQESGKIFYDLSYGLYHTPQQGTWVGVSDTVYVVDIPFDDTPVFFYSPISGIPDGIDETGDTVNGSYYEKGGIVIFTGDNEFAGMVNETPTEQKGNYIIAPNELPIPNRKRISTEHSLYNENDCFVVMERSLVWFRYENDGFDNVDLIELYPSATLEDFCYYNGQIIVANGTSTLQVFDVKTTL